MKPSNKEIAENSIDLRNLNDTIYQKDLPVALTRYELFRYGVDADKDISAKLEDLNKKVSEIEEFERKNALLSNGSETEVEISSPRNEEIVSDNQ